MKEIGFIWDTRKATQNLRKHKVSFEEASTVFFDEKAIEYFDPNHSKNEDRFLMLGLSWRLRTLVVCYCIREHGSQIRIISAGGQRGQRRKFILENENEERIRFLKDERTQKSLRKESQEASYPSTWDRCYRIF